MWDFGGMRPSDIETERLVLIALLAADVEALVAGTQLLKGDAIAEIRHHPENRGRCPA